jgi:hypothetical protein
MRQLFQSSLLIFTVLVLSLIVISEINAFTDDPQFANWQTRNGKKYATTAERQLRYVFRVFS